MPECHRRTDSELSWSSQPSPVNSRAWSRTPRLPGSPKAFTSPDGTKHPPILPSITGIPANDAGSDGMMESASLSANTSQPDGKALPDRIQTCSVLPSDLIISAIYAGADGRTESAPKFPGCYPTISASDLVAAFAATAENAATGFPFCFK